MSDEGFFRWVLVAGLVAILPVVFYHRLRAATSEKLDRRQEGIFILVSLRLLGFVGMLGVLAYLIDPASMAWSSVVLFRAVMSAPCV